MTITAHPVTASRIEVDTTADLPIGPANETLGYADAVEDNNVRARFAAVGVKAYAERTGTDQEEPAVAMSELLSDLRHLADALGQDWDELLSEASHNYDGEL